jgi:sugar lactone lactonase YvrE
MMELLIATGEIPVTVGVFVRPGTLPAPMQGTLDRRNRCFEYDGVSDNNVRFFTEELLPFVAKEYQLSGYDYQFRIIDGGHVAGYMDNYREAMAYLWRGWPERVKAGPSAPRAQEILIPREAWQLVAADLRDARAPACNAAGEVFFLAADQVRRIGLDGAVTVFAARAEGATGLTAAADGRRLHAVSSRTGKIVAYDGDGNGTASPVLEDIAGNHILAMPDGSLYVTSDDDDGSVWRVKDGKKSCVDTGLKHPTGLAYRPDQWLLAVAEGASKWTCSYQIAADGTLVNKERFFWHHVADWDDDTGAESVCYSPEGRMFVATRIGIQIIADDGPTQVILPVPDRARVLGVCLGGKDKDTLFALCGDKIWRRKVQHHAMGAFTPWTKVIGTKL